MEIISFAFEIAPTVLYNPSCFPFCFFLILQVQSSVIVDPLAHLVKLEIAYFFDILGGVPIRNEIGRMLHTS